MSERSRDEDFMREALAEAALGCGLTSPNPVVGALVVREGHIVGRGHHARAGGPHAEVGALAEAATAARGADLYVTLEPCDHQGRTPPCTEAILRAGIARIIVGCEDVNPLVRGRGVKRLREAGLEVIEGVLEAQAHALNAPFFKFITRHLPYVTLKVAATLDGKIATATGDSKWVTGEAARERVHRLRSRVDAILVGARTVRADHPRLTARVGGVEGARQPLRVVVSRTLDLDPDAPLFQAPGRTLILTVPDAPSDRRARLEAVGSEVVALEGPTPRTILDALAARDVLHLLVEGGAGLFGAFLESGLADELLLFLAPKILGEGRSFAELTPHARMDEALRLGPTTIERVGDDWLVRADLAR